MNVFENNSFSHVLLPTYNFKPLCVETIRRNILLIVTGTHLIIHFYKYIFTLNKITYKNPTPQPSCTIIFLLCGMTDCTVDLTFDCNMVLAQASPNKFV